MSLDSHIGVIHFPVNTKGFNPRRKNNIGIRDRLRDLIISFGARADLLSEFGGIRDTIRGLLPYTKEEMTEMFQNYSQYRLRALELGMSKLVEETDKKLLEHLMAHYIN